MSSSEDAVTMPPSWMLTLAVPLAVCSCNRDAIPSTESASASVEASVVSPTASGAPSDPRLAVASAHAKSRRWREAAEAYRAVMRDTSASASTRHKARVDLVSVWLERESATPDPPACMDIPKPSARPSEGRMLPDVIAARRDARKLLACADTGGLETSRLRARLDALDAADREACARDGKRAVIEGAVLGGGASDPCAEPTSAFAGGGPLPSALDNRMGIPAPNAGPSHR